MEFRNSFFKEVHDLFTGENTNGTQLHQLVLNHIEHILEKGFKTSTLSNLIAEERFENFKPLLPKGSSFTEFKKLCTQCYLARKMGYYTEKAPQIILTPSDTIHFREEYKLLGDAAEDISGASYLQLPVN